MHERVRIKVCGVTRIEDVRNLVAEGVDAVGFVFYKNSPRYVSSAIAKKLWVEIPPFVTSVGLFVNSTMQEVAHILAQVPVNLLQFHGDETLTQCCVIAEHVHRPFVRAIRVQPNADLTSLLEYESQYRHASPLFQGLLLDTYTKNYGGSGTTFDWSLIPKELSSRIILSGGLTTHNIASALKTVRPYAVDVSSGVEIRKGEKDRVMVRAFVDAVRQIK